MARLINGFEQFFDGAGDPLVSGKLFFYESGSSSALKDTYADSAETIKNSNPVILNGDGRAPNVFGSGSYRVILTDADEVQLVQRDPIGGVTGTTFGSDWNSTQIYSQYDVVLDDGSYWISVISNNQGNQPSIDSGVNWVYWPGGRVIISADRPDSTDLRQGDTWIDSDYAADANALYYISDPSDPTDDALRAIVNTATGDWLDSGNSESIDVDCSTGGTITLTPLQNAYGVLNLTGTPGAPFNVVVDTSKRMRTVINGTDGVATVKTSTGTGEDVVNGTSRPVLCDGTNVVDPFSEATALPSGYIVGLLWSNNGTDATNDFDVSPGKCRSSDDTAGLVLAAGQTKQMDATWATGTNAGAITATAWGATGWVAGQSYHVFLAEISGTVEVIVDTDASGANIDTDHSSPPKRHIFSFLSETGPALPIGQAYLDGMNVRFVNDYTADDVSNTGSTGGALATLAVPKGISVLATIAWYCDGNGASVYSRLEETHQTSLAPDANNADNRVASTGYYASMEISKMTDTNGQIRYRQSAALATHRIATRAYIFMRGI